MTTTPQSSNPLLRFARPDDIDRIVALDRRYLPADTIVSETVFRAWHRNNPEIFTCLLVDGEICGYYSVLPLARPALERFVAGKLAEKDLAADDIVPPDALAAQCSTLYFYSIVLDAAQRPLLGQLLRHFAARIEAERRRRAVRRVYATAATPAGRRLLERLGFSYRAAAGERADGHDLYALDGEALERLTERAAMMAPRGAER